MKRINARSWNSAIRTVQEHLVELPAHFPVSAEQDRLLTLVYALCEHLTAEKCFPAGPTNGELATKYAISERTVRNWRREGCPFEQGQWRVLDWIAERRYAPAGTRAKFGRQLDARESSRFAWVRAVPEFMRQLKLAHKLAGVELEPDSWLRRVRCPRH